MVTGIGVKGAEEYVETMMRCEAVLDNVKSSSRSLGRVEGATAGFLAGLAVAVAMSALALALRGCEPVPAHGTGTEAASDLDAEQR